jgi:mannose-6-phosphate isomerase
MTKVRRIEKPWGYELLLARTKRYAGKILCVHAGHCLSLQHHTTKDETLYLLEGEAELALEADSRGLCPHRMAPDRSYRIRAGQRHRLAGLTDARILEVSTPELEDVVRWEDNYGRASPPDLLKQPEPCEGDPARRECGACRCAGRRRCPIGSTAQGCQRTGERDA